MASERGVYHWNRNNTNSLLTKDEVGRSKPSTYKLPQKEFAYGKPLPHDAEGVKEVSLTWKYHMDSNDIRPDRDFKKLNKMAISSKLHRSEQFNDFRKSHDARVKVVKGKHTIEMKLPAPDFVYGQPNRPSTPVREILGQDYGNEAALLQKEKYRRITSAKESTRYSSKKQYSQTKHTKASQLCDSAIKEKLDQRVKVDNEPFKLSKFKNVAGKTQTKTWIRPQSAQPSKQSRNDNVSEQYRIPSEGE